MKPAGQINIHEDWFTSLEAIDSRGELAEAPGGLAGCAAARREHAGQFFTPPSVVRMLWNLLGSVMLPIATGTSNLITLYFQQRTNVGAWSTLA